jgi:hypothetical protein
VAVVVVPSMVLVLVLVVIAVAWSEKTQVETLLPNLL